MHKLIRYYSYHWFKLNIYLIIILAICLLLFWNDLEPLRRILCLSLGALFIYQFEEYQLPGGGPVVINKGNFGEKEYWRTYPGNMLSSMIVNNSAWLVYIVAIIEDQWLWLGLGTMFFNLFQIIGHGIKMNKGMHTWYNPGLLSTLICFLPVSIFYFKYAIAAGCSATDWLLGAVAFILLLLLTTILPVQLLKDRNSAYPMPQWQIDRCDKVQRFASLR